MRPRRFDEATVLEIRRSRATGKELAALYGVSSQAIYGIRNGRSYRDLEEGMPLNGGVSCRRCVHWCDQGELCTLEFPDPLLEGTTFARDCSVFQRRPR